VSEPEQPREPVVHEKEMTAHVSVRASGQATVERGLTEIRLAVLGIVLTIALSLASVLPASWPVRLAGGVLAFVAACVLIRWTWSRTRAMRFAAWLLRE
jgi:Flp pilus assembly protein TadB